MNRILYILFFVSLVFLMTDTHAQERTITGLVTDAKNNEPIPGATVLVVGETGGVITNIDGVYQISVSTGVDSLEFRFVGMQSKKLAIDNRSTIDVALSEELYKMDEVIVTALGITREAKTVGYSVTSVDEKELQKANGRSPLNALSGKIAGVNISSSSGAPGSSTRVLVRGVTSLIGGNQPLFVIDGVPVTNSRSGSTSINGGTDFGNTMNDINPNDIESINFLKGASATALYGSRASNGVVEITTKKGKLATKTDINFSTSVGFEEPLRLVQYQNDYGQGIFGNSVLYENMSWGPAFDWKYHPWGYEVDGKMRVKAYQPLEDNVEEFFETGRNISNTLSLSGGNEQTTYYFAYGNTFWDGIFPTNADSYQKHTLSLRGSHKANDKLKLSTSINYINKTNSFVPTGQGEQSVYNQVMQTPRDISLLELEDLDTAWNSVDNYYSLYTLNPWFILKQNSNKNFEDRVYGSLTLDLDLMKGFNAVWRMGGDISNSRRRQWSARVIPEGNNEFSAIRVLGSEGRSSGRLSQFSNDVILTYEKNFNKFFVTARAGNSINQRKSESIFTSVSSPAVAGFHSLSNSTQRPVSGESQALQRMATVYGNLDLSYNKWFNISVTARNEWSSTLPKQNNSYFFPGVSGSFVFTEILPIEKDILTFGKLRGSWAQVGNDAPPYLLESSYGVAGHSDGFGYYAYPLDGGISGYEVG
ncbi:MAG: SusC/RagA family TonB-linked outer membrane protein, partial [Bacteroidales bacterium]|nr:SusC/RagA family TonB-linked outer membrane protein [Bacteroidales bacterium]